jgi:glutamine amidotransferase
MIDMGMGNLQSVLQAFGRIGARVTVTTRPEDLERAGAVILPGVGAFGDGMASLNSNGLLGPLRRHAGELRRPLLGICIGMQLLAEEGEEHGRHAGLSLIRGRVVRLRPTDGKCRVPNMGWCDVEVNNPNSPLFARVPDGDAFYFAHSYHVQCADPADVAGTIQYGGCRLTAAVQRGNIWGVQFHPEKSQDAGLNVLAAFIDYLQTGGLG